MPVTTRSKTTTKKRKVDKNQNVKLLNKDLNHYGFQWKEGLNELKGDFNMGKKCGEGGLYYCKANQVYKHVNYMKPSFIADVTIPDDAKTVQLDTKAKSDKVILSNIQPFEEWSAFGDEEIINDFSFKYVPEAFRQLM